MTILPKGWSVFQKSILATFLLYIIGTVKSAPATTQNVLREIPDGQIQNLNPTQSVPSLFKATDIAGVEIIYVGSVGLNTLGSLTTELLGTARLATTTNSAGSAIIGVVQVTVASQSAFTTIIPESVIPSLSSTPPFFAFQSVDANGQPIVNLGQTFVRSNGSTSTAILQTGISTSHITISDSQDSTTVEIVGVFTRSNGSVVTNALSFADKVSSLALSESSATPLYQTAPTTTGSQDSLGTHPKTNRILNVSISDTARNTGSKSARSQGSSPANWQNASLATSQQRSLSHRFSNLKTSSVSSSVASTGISNLLNHGLSSTHASSESMLNIGSISAPITTATVQKTLDGHGTILISGERTSKSGLITDRGTGGGAAQAATSAAGHATVSMTANLTSKPSVTGRSNSTRALSSDDVGGLLLAVQSDSAILSGLTALLGEQLATLTTVPSGISIQTVTSTTCSTAFAMATTTAAGDTVTQVVPKLCNNGIAFFLFGWTKLPGLCTKRLRLFGFLLQLICDRWTGIPVGVDIISYPPPSGSSDDTPSSPKDDPQHEDDGPSNTPNPSERASFTRSPHSAISQGSASWTSSTRTISATTSTSSACSGATTVSGTSKMCCDNSTVIGTISLCNYQKNGWVEDLGPFLTTSIPIPASARPISMPGTPIALNTATLAAFFDSLISEMVAYAANFTVTTPATSRNRSTSALTASTLTASALTASTLTASALTAFALTAPALTAPALPASATAAALGAGSGLIGILKGGISAGEAEQALSTALSAPAVIPTSDRNPVGLIQGATSAGESTPPTPTLACTQYFFYEDDGPNNFVCQCNDGTWNHRPRQDTYSLCPSQVTTVSLTAADSLKTTIPPGVSCTLVNYAPNSVDFLPFCECSNDLLFPDECPSSVRAATTTLTFSEPLASVTAALTKGDYITPIMTKPAPPPSPTTSSCVPQCTKYVSQNGPEAADLDVTCVCNPACGGNARPKPNANLVCPNQVAVED